MNNRNNFYIAVPMTFNNGLVMFENGKFKKALLKCGEAIGQSVEIRLKAEAANSGGMDPLFQFYIDPARIDTKKTSHFDTTLFGHLQIANVWKSTIWKNMPGNLIPKTAGKKSGFGQEYMDFTKALNKWMKSSETKSYESAIKTAEVGQHEYCIGVRMLIKKLLNENMPALVEKYAEKISKPELKLFNHQILGLRHIAKMLENGKRNIIAQLPCRYGKTLSFLDLFKHSPWKLMIVASYMKTVGNSYIKEASAYKDFEDIQIVDIDDCSDFKYGGGKTMVVFPTTGNDETIAKRIETLKKLNAQIKAGADDIFLLNEEADYANHTEKTDNKFDKLVKTFGRMTVISTTGTEAYKAAKLNAFGEFDGRISCNPNDWNQFFV